MRLWILATELFRALSNKSPPMLLMLHDQSNSYRHFCSCAGHPAWVNQERWFVAMPKNQRRKKMLKISSTLAIAAVVMLTGYQAQAANCPAGYKLFSNTPNQWNTPGNWSVSKPCCRGSGGDVEIAYCVAYAKNPVGSVGSGCKPGDAKCNQGHDVRKGDSRQQQ